MAPGMNARMMRSKMGLEIAAEIFTRRMFSMGNVLSLSITSGSDEPPFPRLAFGFNGDSMGGMRAPIEVGTKRTDVAFVNPSPVVTMAYRGRGFYKRKWPLRALASFPSWDRIAFAVSKELGIRSLRDIARRRIPLRIATRSSGVDNTTHYTVSKILSLHGLSFAKIKQWGGSWEESPWPSSPRRKESIRRGEVNAVFDEGIHTWLDEALECGFEVLHLESDILRALQAMGYRRAVIPRARHRGLVEDIRTIDFSGWPLITHHWLDNDIAYSICEAIDARKKVITIDDKEPLNMKNICRSTESGPLQIPLHPGARKFYREKGYLR
jgi:TRAP-type uncharacterized transport system substrate-binding protein